MRYRFYMGAPEYIVHLVAHINLKEFPLVHQCLNGPLPSSQAQSKVEILQGSPNIKCKISNNESGATLPHEGA